MIYIIGGLLIIVLFGLLPQLMYIVLVAFTCYLLCKTMKRKTMGQMIVLICIFTSLNLVIAKVKPICDKYKVNSEFIEKEIERYSESESEIDNSNIDKDSRSDIKKVWDFLNKYPNEKSDK